MQGGRRFRAVKRRRRNLKNPPLRRISQKKLTCNVSLTAAVTCWQNDVNNSPHTHTHTLVHFLINTQRPVSTNLLNVCSGIEANTTCLICFAVIPPDTHTLTTKRPAHFRSIMVNYKAAPFEKHSLFFTT